MTATGSSPRPARVPPLRIGALDTVLGPDTATHAAAGVLLSGVTLRAQDARPGDLFAALPGRRVHGVDHAADALGRGAVAILTDAQGAPRARELGVAVLEHPDPRAVLGRVSDAVYGRPSRHLQIVGLTGTSGKTTTAYLVEAGLRAAGRRTGLIGTVETRIDGAVAPSAFTTPEAPDLQALLAVMVERGVDSVVMEVSSHALALGRVDGTRFAVAGFTNLSREHLDFHPDMEAYFAAKAQLFDPGAPVVAARSVVCVDDEWGARMAELAGKATTTVSTCAPTATGPAAPRSAAQWRAGDVRATPDGGQQVPVRSPHGESVLTLRLPGAYNVANALVALAVLDAVGVEPDKAARALADVDVPGRMERVDVGQPFLAVVDYAHKPAALAAVIAALRAREHASRVGVVVGAGGDRDEGKRAVMGEVGARGADLLVVTDDNPRGEDPAGIRAAVLDGARAVPAAQRAEIREVGDRRAAIRAAAAWAGDGDVVLVAGKGHEAGQEVAGVKHPFDDRHVLAEEMADLAGPVDSGNRS